MNVFFWKHSIQSLFIDSSPYNAGICWTVTYFADLWGTIVAMAWRITHSTLNWDALIIVQTFPRKNPDTGGCSTGMDTSLCLFLILSLRPKHAGVQHFLRHHEPASLRRPKEDWTRQNKRPQYGGVVINKNTNGSSNYVSVSGWTLNTINGSASSSIGTTPASLPDDGSLTATVWRLLSSKDRCTGTSLGSSIEAWRTYRVQPSVYLAGAPVRPTTWHRGTKTPNQR